MDKTVTFSFRSSSFEATGATETFHFKELGLDGDMDDEAMKIQIDKIFQAWVRDKLNISFSIVIDEDE
ncbi:hypothetical protein [Metabacillus malikii]|uniref:Uncharacterized protein n=1 Tax=Metabacillus malikii TaxID=1504265 RepID=A0ABT9ZAE4_9BACI|nr:hypothetical protein [Metabacillus malikii]MDQ0229208.1 hypothetical protein [Metabacillus malikii]